MNEQINNEIEKTINLLNATEGIEVSADFTDIICQRIESFPIRNSVSDIRAIRLDNFSFYFKAAVLLFALNIASVVTMFNTKQSVTTELQLDTYASVVADEYLAGSSYSISY